MFFHNFIYRLKCIVRDKEIMFWTFLFPLILATLFNLALSNVGKAEEFNKINIAVVKEGEYQWKDSFFEVLKEVSESDNKDDNIFNISYVSEKEANDLLDNNKVKGIIYFDNDIRLKVKESGLDQTIMKSFLSEYLQTVEVIGTIGKADLNIVREEYLKEVNIGKTNSQNPINYFYSLIAMTCFYGGFLGIKEVGNLQGNQSSTGARVHVAPIHKAKTFISSILAAVIVQLAVIGILFMYLVWFVKVDFGNEISYMVLLSVMGAIAGVSFGTVLGTLINKKEGTKIAILLGLTMTMSFLSGMMIDKIKYTVEKNLPILSYINPINLITDSLYSLYYFDTKERFFVNISILALFIIICNIGTYFGLRRQKYASL